MILVTGGTGFLGSHLLEKLIENLGEDVGQKDENQKNIRAIHRSTSNPDLMQRFPNVEWLECDVLDVIQLEKAMEGIRQVYHCAAVVSFDSKEKEMMHQINVEGTKNVVNASINANINKFIHVSSIAAIGRKSSQKKYQKPMNGIRT